MVRALGRSGIPVALAAADPGSRARLSRYCAAALRTPSWVDDPNGALDTLIAWGAEQREAPVVFYQGDHDMLALSRGRSRLAPYLRCVLPPAELVEDLADKLRFAALADRLRLPVPLTLTLPRGSELRGWDRFPCVVKPVMRAPRFVQLARNQKALRIRDRSEMDALCRLIAAEDTGFVVQEAIEGGEECIESYHAYLRPGGEVMGDFTGRKIRTAPRLYGFSTYVEITDDDEVRRLGRSIFERIGFSGVAKIDFKRDPRTRRLYLLEINPRFNLWHHAGAVAGVNLPALVYGDLTGRPRPRAQSARAGVRWVYHLHDARAARREGIPLRRWIPWAMRAEAKAIVALDDPLPLVMGGIGRLGAAVGVGPRARRG